MCYNYNFFKGFLTKQSYKDFVGPLRKDGILDIACIHTLPPPPLSFFLRGGGSVHRLAGYADGKL